MMDWSHVPDLIENEILPATEADAREVAKNMSPEDIDEATALGLTPYGIVMMSLKASVEAWTWRPDGKKIAGIFGISPPRQIVGYYGAWMLSTPLLREHGMRFLKYQKPYMAYIVDTYGSLENIVDVRHKTCISWIRWFGGTLYPAEPLGRDGALFYRWEFKKEPPTQSLVIKPVTIHEVEINPMFGQLAEEYVRESAIAGLPEPMQNIERYKLIEKSGIFYGYGAFLGFDLVGFIAVIVPEIPHYGVGIAMTESFFVTRRYRKTGAGLKLLAAAEKHAHKAGSPALFVSATIGSDLEKILPRRGYEQTNSVFLKRFK